jgi:hypothetical protein
MSIARKASYDSNALVEETNKIASLFMFVAWMLAIEVALTLLGS